MIELALVEHLKATPGVVNLVADRIEPQLASTKAFPRIVYGTINTTRPNDLDLETRRSQICMRRIHVHCWGGKGVPGYKAAKDLAWQVVQSIKVFRGTYLNGWEVRYANVEDEYDEVENPEFATADDPRGVLLLVAVSYQEVLDRGN